MAVQAIFEALDGDEGRLTASNIADSIGITRSVRTVSGAVLRAVLRFVLRIVLRTVPGAVLRAVLAVILLAVVS